MKLCVVVLEVAREKYPIFACIFDVDSGKFIYSKRFGKNDIILDVLLNENRYLFFF
jgi:hypothetical protein